MIGPVIKYPGSKWRMAQWIIEWMPPHDCYLEPFFGSGAVFFNKPLGPHEVINDLDNQVVNLMSVIRDRCDELCDLVSLTPWSREEFARSHAPADDPLENARRFLVRCCQAHGRKPGVRTGWRRKSVINTSETVGIWQRLPERIRDAAGRLLNAEIERKDAVELIAEYNKPNVLIYADPPYLASTRSGRQYTCEMTTTEDHQRLLAVLQKHKGPVLISGYRSDLYDELLSSWYTVERPSVAEKGKKRTEVLWSNRPLIQQQMLFEE